MITVLPQAMMAKFMEHDHTDTGLVTESTFRSVMDQFVGFQANETLFPLLNVFPLFKSQPPISI